MENLTQRQSDLAEVAKFLRETEQFLGKLRDKNYTVLSLDDLLAWQMTDKQRQDFSTYLNVWSQFFLFFRLQKYSRDLYHMLEEDEQLKHCFQIVTHAMLMGGVYFGERCEILLNLYLDVWKSPPRFVPQKMSASLVYADVLRWLTANLWRYDDDFRSSLEYALEKCTYYRRPNSSCSEDARRIYFNLCKLCRNDTIQRVFVTVFILMLVSFTFFMISKAGDELVNYFLCVLMGGASLVCLWDKL